MSRAETDGFDAFYHALSVTAAACVAVALVVGGVTALRRPIPVENLTGGSGFVAGGPVRFIPLRALGTPIGFDSPAWNQNVLPRVRAVATVQDDRVVLTWQLADGTVLMGAVSLPSGQSLFGPVPVGRYESWNLRVMGTGVLVDGIRAQPRRVGHDHPVGPGPARPRPGHPVLGWVYGIYRDDGSPRPLGKIIAQASGCSFDNRFLACPTPTGLGIWRFAG